MKNKDTLVKENLGLVHACCKRFQGKGFDYEELYSAGCLGLIKAINNFKPELNLQLSTYAVPVILGEIKCLFRDSGAVKVSRSLKELNLKINKATLEFQKSNNRSPTVIELAEILKVSSEKINDALNSALHPLSLTNDDEDNKSSQIDLPTEDIMEKVTEKLALKEVIKKLNDNDKNIINLRYYKLKTQTETAKILDMTQVQISRREKKILTFLRHNLTV